MDGRQRWPDRRALVVIVTSRAVQHFYVGGLAITYLWSSPRSQVSYGLLGAVLTAAGLLGGLLQGAAGLIRRVSAGVPVQVWRSHQARMARAVVVGSLGWTSGRLGSINSPPTGTWRSRRLPSSACFFARDHSRLVHECDR